MLRKTFFICLVIAMVFCTNSANAQTRSSSYKTALGMHLDLGDGNLYGFSLKHFLSRQLAGHANLLFGSGVSASLGAELQYHVPIANATGLQWYIGGGLQALFIKNSDRTAVWMRPMIGLDYKINTAPINLSFDWRPTFQLNYGGGSDVGRFGVGIRFTL